MVIGSCSDQKTVRPGGGALLWWSPLWVQGYKQQEVILTAEPSRQSQEIGYFESLLVSSMYVNRQGLTCCLSLSSFLKAFNLSEGGSVT